MKTIPRVSYEDKDWKKIQKVKTITGKNWHDFILYLIKVSGLENLKGGK